MVKNAHFSDKDNNISNLLFRILQSYLIDNKDWNMLWKHLPNIIINYLLRLNIFTEKENKKQSNILRATLIRLSENWPRSDTLENLLKFCEYVVDSLNLKNLIKTNIIDTDNVQLMKKIILSESNEGVSCNLISTRAAKRFYEIKQKENLGKISINLKYDKTLLNILGFPDSDKIKIFKNDFRNLILKNSLISTIKKASCFSDIVLKKALGNEFFKYLKPVGFSDYSEKTILIAVNSTSVAHEMYFNKSEILKRLRLIKEFSKLINIKFIIRHQIRQEYAEFIK